MNHPDYTNALYNVGNFYRIEKKYNDAISHFLRAIKSNADLKKVAQSYCQIGECLSRKGDYYKSIEFYLKGFPLIEKYGKKTSVIAHYINFAYNCAEINSKEISEQGLPYLKKADSIIKNTPYIHIKNHLLNHLHNSFAIIYSSAHNYNFEKSKFYYQKIISNSKSIGDSTTTANTYLNLGELYLDKKNDSAIYLLNKGIKFDINKENLNELYRNTALFHTHKQNYLIALDHISKSLKYNFQLKKGNKISDLSKNKIINIQYKTPSIRALKLKSRILINLFFSTKKQEYLEQIIDNIRLTNKLVSVIVNYSSETNTKYLWREHVAENFKIGIYACHLLQNSELMFEFMEANRAFFTYSRY